MDGDYRPAKAKYVGPKAYLRSVSEQIGRDAFLALEKAGCFDVTVIDFTSVGEDACLWPRSARRAAADIAYAFNSALESEKFNDRETHRREVYGLSRVNGF